MSELTTGDMTRSIDGITENNFEIYINHKNGNIVAIAKEAYIVPVVPGGDAEMFIRFEAREPDDAIKGLWKMMTELPTESFVVVNMYDFRDKRAVVWSPEQSSWVDYYK